MKTDLEIWRAALLVIEQHGEGAAVHAARRADEIIRLTPVIPLIGAGRTMLRPIHVRDVAEAARRSLQNPGSEGHIYELGRRLTRFGRSQNWLQLAWGVDARSFRSHLGWLVHWPDCSSSFPLRRSPSPRSTFS